MTGLALRKIGWFFLRDLSIARSYRVMFVFELIETLLGVASFYYLSRFIEVPAFGQTQVAGGYFAFAVVGFAFFDYLTVAQRLRSEPRGSAPKWNA